VHFLRTADISADPSNIWKTNGHYYMQAGNKGVLFKYGIGKQPDKYYQGGWTDLFRSKDLKNWEYVDRFYEYFQKEESWPAYNEDAMCPTCLPITDQKSNGKLTGKWLQTFISHNRGGQYYVGLLEGERFYPLQHGRFSWNDNLCFAPEALLDDKNRHIAWFWLADNTKRDFEKWGWSGVLSFPRVFWLEDDVLHMAPAEELDQLQYHHQSFEVTGGDQLLPVKNGESFRLKASLYPGNALQPGFTVRSMADGSEETRIYYDSLNQKLVMDTTNSGKEGMKIKEEAPFALREGETLNFDIFVDKSVVEVYVNERQAISRRVYPAKPEEAVCVFTKGFEGAEVLYVDAWEIAPTNPY